MLQIQLLLLLLLLLLLPTQAQQAKQRLVLLLLLLLLHGSCKALLLDRVLGVRVLVQVGVQQMAALLCWHKGTLAWRKGMCGIWGQRDHQGGQEIMGMHGGAVAIGFMSAQAAPQLLQLVLPNVGA